MSEVIVRGIRCDYGHRRECGSTFYVQAQSMAEVRHLARALGWSTKRPFGRPFDVCPGHR